MADLNDKKPEDSKELVDIIGHFGPWQTRILLLSTCLLIPHVWHVMGIVFFAPNIDYWCKRPFEYSNFTNDQWKALAIPLDPKTTDNATYSHCFMYKKFNNSSVEKDDSVLKCSSWEYDRSLYKSTIIEEWDLVCSNEWLVSLSTSVYMSGFLSTVFISGQLADRIGRRPVILINIAIFLVSALACTFSTSFAMFTAFRYFVAFGASGAITTGFVLCWTTGYILLPGIAWFVRDWFTLQLTLTVPWIILSIHWWLLPESPRWLLTHGKIEQAEKEIATAMRLNHKNVTNIKEIVQNLKRKEVKREENKKISHPTFLDLLKTVNMRRKSVNIFFTWLIVSFAFYGLSLRTNDLGGNPYLNFFIAGVIEYPAAITAMFSIKHLGRRKPLMVLMVSGGLACVLTILVPAYLHWLLIVLTMFGKFCVSASFSIIYVYSAELFPTVVRNVGVGSSSMFARVGSMVAPFVKELGEATNRRVPQIIFGSLSVISGLLVLLLPETNRMHILDTLEEGENFGKKLPSFVNNAKDISGTTNDSKR
ncbi:organic cation transporter protein-like isoform X2 [Tachypleus tridentatus]|uniref:organic cation transporter protein-like isoform X2 n=1 Tax=Tachypleus tridentatus TaxID=6853 RepID=UPI003FD5DE30